MVGCFGAFSFGKGVGLDVLPLAMLLVAAESESELIVTYWPILGPNQTNTRVILMILIISRSFFLVLETFFSEKRPSFGHRATLFTKQKTEQKTEFTMNVTPSISLKKRVEYHHLPSI